MISFEVKKLDINYLSCSVTIKVKKQIEVAELNHLLRFYLNYGNKDILLDTSNYYTLSMPSNPHYFDNLLNNEEELKFNIYIPELISGINCKIRAINNYSQTIYWQSENLFLKTKQIETPIFSVENYFDDVLKSKITFETILDREHTQSFYMKQYVHVEGNEHFIIAESNYVMLGDQTLSYDVKKYASYRIVTKIFNVNNELMLEDKSYYIKLLQPLPVLYKQKWNPFEMESDIHGSDIDHPEWDNFKVKKIRNMLYKRKKNDILRVTDIIIKR